MNSRKPNDYDQKLENKQLLSSQYIKFIHILLDKEKLQVRSWG